MEKALKSTAAARRVPIHPQLLEMGMLAFVKHRQKQRKGKGRLFFEVAFGADGVPSTLFSKWFARLLNSADLGDPALVFHSFRHLAKDALRGSLAPSYIVDQIIGHEDQSSAEYGDGAPLEALHTAVKGMIFPVDLRKIVQRPMPH